VLCIKDDDLQSGKFITRLFCKALQNSLDFFAAACKIVDYGAVSKTGDCKGFAQEDGSSGWASPSW
jgi:hypothetical protein